MARIRTIKPEFCTSSQIVECSTSARLLFVTMWCFCDDAGRHVADVMRLKMECFPGDTFSKSEMSSLVEELISAGLLVEYEVNDEVFWAVKGWKKHQKIDRPTVRYPSPEEGRIRRALDEPSTSPPRVGVEPSPPEGNGMEGKGSIKSIDVASATSHSSSESRTASGRVSSKSIDLVIGHYKTFHPLARPGEKERKLVAARIKEGYSTQDLINAIDGQHVSPHHNGKNDSGTKYLSLELCMRNSSKVTQFIEAKSQDTDKDEIPF